MTDSWTALFSRPGFLLPHPDPYPFTKQLSKSQSHCSLRSKLRSASRPHQFPSSRSLVTHLVRRATTTSKPSTLGDRAPKLDPLYFPVVELTVPSYEEDMEGLARARHAPSSSSPKAKRGIAQADAKIGYNNGSDDENDNDNGTGGRTANSHLVGSWRSSRFGPRTALQNPLHVPGDQLQLPSHLQHAEPRLVHDMTEEFTSPYSLSSSSPSNSSSNCSIILHTRSTSTPSSTPAIAFSMIDVEMNTDTNAKIAVTKVEQKAKEIEIGTNGRSTSSAPPLTWAKVAFDTTVVPGEASTSSTSTSTWTSGSISISASTACRRSPAPDVVVTTDIDIADKDTMAEGARSKSTPMRWKTSGKAQRQLDDGGECKSDTQSATSSSPFARKHQTYVHKHRRTASLGDAAVSLLFGVEHRKDNRNDDDDEREDFEFSEKWIENTTQHTNPIKRARFVIFGSESDVDLPLHPEPHSEPPLFSSSPTSSPLASKVSSAANLPVSTQPQAQQQPLHPVSTSSPALVRRDALADSHEPVRRRRRTLASAMTDEAISDEGLVRELEKMHKLGVWNRELLSKGGERSSEDDNTILVDADSIWDVGREIWEGMSDREKEKENVDEHDDVPPKRCSSLLGSSSWLAAQRALLICRELIMTERHYHALLLSLLAGDTHTPPPLLMQHYAAELERASAAVLRAMEQQPSALGVAKAFVENVEELEGAYVRWCGVVGGWFVAGGDVEESGNVKLKRNWSRYRSSIDSATPPATRDTPGCGGVDSEDGHTASAPVNPLKRTVRTWRRSLPSVASLGEAGASIYGYGYGYGSRSLRRRNKDKVAEEEQSDGRDLSSTTTPSSSSSSGQNLVSQPPRVRRKPAVRDLAILPTQRVLRYVLLYRDLLSHTPATSSSHMFVEKAVDAACKIADKCDRAQGNAAFIVARGGGAAAGGSSPAATQSAAEAETTSRRSNSGRTTATTSSVDSTPPSSVEGERQREEAEDAEQEGQGKLESSDGCHVKLSSSMRRVSMGMSFVSSIGWGRS